MKIRRRVRGVVGGRRRWERRWAVRRTRRVAVRERMVVRSIVRVEGGEGADIFVVLGWRLVGGWF